MIRLFAFGLLFITALFIGHTAQATIINGSYAGFVVSDYIFGIGVTSYSRLGEPFNGFFTIDTSLLPPMTGGDGISSALYDEGYFGYSPLHPQFMHLWLDDGSGLLDRGFGTQHVDLYHSATQDVIQLDMYGPGGGFGDTVYISTAPGVLFPSALSLDDIATGPISVGPSGYFYGVGPDQGSHLAITSFAISTDALSTSIPEPSSLALVGLALGAGALARRWSTT
ncbi:MAG: hypothetical protein JWN23_929 [Rhodocyclales bacterium]|nr:hypothetical protein [Rhodocyclales bacterium]